MGQSREDILLKERIAQIDDFNLDKIFDANEKSEIELQKFEEPAPAQNIEFITNIEKEKKLEAEPVFSMEIAPNEFLDNIAFKQETPKQTKKSKLNVQNKPLFFALTSIAFLLGILFIYNLFVLSSLEGSTKALASTNAVVTTATQENNLITFENGNTLTIEVLQNTSNKDLPQTNWFDSLVNGLNQMFGENEQN